MKSDIFALVGIRILKQEFQKEILHIITRGSAIRYEFRFEEEGGHGLV
jgi:hypothetical protein